MQTMAQGNSWLDPRVVVGPSRIHGLGLHARAPIAAGEVVIRWRGEILPVTELVRLKDRPRYDCATLSESTIMVFAANDPVIHGNHSCDPNLWMEGAVSESARRDIAAGEELTVDYALHSDDPSWTMECHCDASLCRGVITGVDWKDPELQARYLDHFAPHLAARFALLGERPLTPPG
jgi:SET domain-containing protein